MKIIYLASMYDEETYKKIFVKSSKPIPQAGKYHRLMCEGLIKNDAEVKTIASLPINKRYYDGGRIKAFSKEQNGVVYRYLSTMNNPLAKAIYHYFGGKRAVKKEKSADVLVVDYLNIFAVRGAIKAAKRKRIKVVGIVTDLPEFLSTDNKTLKLLHDNLQMCDGYVFLSEQMNEKVNPDKKPYIVLEGHSDGQMIDRKHYASDDGKKIILYAGSCYKKYGILDLCCAFNKVYKENEELHIYGGADIQKINEAIGEENKNIKLYGIVPNSVVVEAELHANLLVNPRRSDEEFTKYSFPSKTMEYMSAGTPVLMYDLPGMPREYLKYLFLIDYTDDPVDAIGKSIRKVLDSEIDLCDFGNKAKEFVLKNKNNVIQAKKLIEFLNILLNGNGN